MFGSNAKTAPAAETTSDRPLTSNATERVVDVSKPRGILSSGVSIKGDLIFHNELLIDGQVEGKISGTGTLTVGKNGRIRGEVRTKSVTVQGTIEGNVIASERCVLEPDATLRGDVEAQRLAVDEAATFFGSAKITGKRGQ